jgi:hypothetical protein
MTSKKQSTGGKVFRIGAIAAAGAAATYGGRALWQKLPAIMASIAPGQVGKTIGKLRAGAVEGASRVAEGARQNASRAASATRDTAEKAASGAASAGSRTSAAARKADNGGPAAKSEAQKPA